MSGACYSPWRSSPPFVAASVARAATQPGAKPARLVKATSLAPGFYRGKTVPYLDFVPIKLAAGTKRARIWAVTNGVRAQHNVVDTRPGDRDHTPLRSVNKVTFKNGVAAGLLKSAAEIRAAAAAGDATIERTPTVLDCPVL